MKRLTVVLFVCIAFSGLGNAAEQKIAYERNEAIFVTDLDGNRPKKIAQGALPEISPDGTRIAFNTVGDAKNRPGPERHIAIADVATSKVTVLPSIPSDNCFGPVWSPDGKQLAFSIMADKAWRLGLVNADGSGFRVVKNAELRPEAFGAPEWARDGKSIFCHDLDNIYQIDLDGNVLKKWELSKFLTDASMNSGDRLSVSPDGKALLMDVDCGSEHERKNWDGPQPAIEKLDLTADTAAVRVTGKDDFVWEPFWLNANEFLCIIQKEKENEASIYRMSLDGKNPKLLVKHARTPSASAPCEKITSIRHCHVRHGGFVLWRIEEQTSIGLFLTRISPKINPRFFAPLRMTTVLIGSRLAQNVSSSRKRLRHFAGVFSGTLRALRPSAAFSAYNRRNLLDQFVRLKLRR